MRFSNLLVTGGSGFIGTNFIKYILKNTNCSVVNYDKLTYAANKNSHNMFSDDKRYSFVLGDINDTPLLDKTVKESKIDAIINFAAETHVSNSIVSPERFVKTNVNGTLSILSVVRKNNLKLHHISTDEVFGPTENETRIFNEESPYHPTSPYSASKAAADHLVESFIKTYGIDATISFSSNNFGPYQHSEKLIPKTISRVMNNKKPIVFGDGTHKRNWLYVLDYCRAIKLILEYGKKGEKYCISGKNEMTNLSLVKKILRIIGKNEDFFEFSDLRPTDDKRYLIDDSKIKTQFGFKTIIDFDSALEDTVKWYLENEKWLRELRSF